MWGYTVLRSSMLKFLLVLFVTLASQTAAAASVEGKIVAGGGIDDLGLVVETADGKRIDAYCLDKCGDWFLEDDKGEGQRLKPALRGKRVRLEYVRERNRDRIAGPGADEQLNFIKSVKFTN